MIFEPDGVRRRSEDGPRMSQEPPKDVPKVSQEEPKEAQIISERARREPERLSDGPPKAARGQER